jgi:5-methyltetrahydropteroyltriglutamate--homocysteine methyltransferase
MMRQIPTTHAGSLPRPPELLYLLHGSDRGADFEAAARQAVAKSSRRQREAGLTVVNDGEMAKPSFSTYVTSRLTGFAPQRRPRAPNLEQTSFPEFYGARVAAADVPVSTCVGPVSWTGDAEVRRDLENLRQALAGAGGGRGFLTAASPGLVWYYQPNEHYQTHEQYVFTVAEAMKHEYDAIAAAGFILQLDAPDLAGGSARPEFKDKTIDDFRRFALLHVEALNHATRDIPPESMRLHICWGNMEGPHVRDVPLAEIVDLLLKARPAGLSFEAANPRHEHEWKLWRDVRLPEGKYLVPGVIDSTTNYVEHPELVAERVLRFIEVAAPERVVAGADCGFATLSWTPPLVHPTIVWLKLRSLAEGAQLASLAPEVASA